MADEKRLFSPDSSEQLLSGWLLHSHKSRDRHDLASRKYAKGQYALGIPALIVSTIVGTSVFSALSSKEVPGLWVGLLSITAAVLTAVQTFMDFGGRSDKHRIAAVKYKAAIRALEYLQVRLSKKEPVTDDEVSAIRTHLDSLEEAAPIVMPSVYDQIEQRYRDVKYVNDALALYRSAPISTQCNSNLDSSKGNENADNK